jgi:putative membrane protein
MKYVRMIVWMLLLVVLVAFSIANWNPVEVKIWDNLILETKIPALVIVAFLLGLVPMWLIHRGVRWRLERRIAGLETAHRNLNPAPTPAPAPAASETIPGL